MGAEMMKGAVIHGKRARKRFMELALNGAREEVIFVRQLAVMDTITPTSKNSREIEACKLLEVLILRCWRES